MKQLKYEEKKFANSSPAFPLLQLTKDVTKLKKMKYYDIFFTEIK
jgi:hypothetical protein